MSARRCDILVDVTPLQSDHRLRGVGTYTRELTRALLAADPERITCLASTVGRQWVPPDIAAHTVFGWRAHRPAQAYWLYNEPFLRAALARLRPRVFHAPDFNGLVAAPGTGTVATLHDLMPLDDPPGKGGSARASYWRWQVYYHRKLPQAHHVIAVSSAVAEDAQRRLAFPSERITVIPPGVSGRFSPGERGRGAFAARPPYWLFVGAEAPNKNLPRVLAALAQLDRAEPWSLIVAGAWRPGHLAPWRQRAAALGIAHRIHWAGHVPDDDLPSLYANALGLLFPSLDEGFGLPAIEGMASGIPVITSNRPPLSDVAGTAGVLVDPLSADALARALSDLLDRPRWRAELGRRGTAQALPYTWAAAARRTLAVYDQGMSGPGRSGRGASHR